MVKIIYLFLLDTSNVIKKNMHTIMTYGRVFYYLFLTRHDVYYTHY